MKLKSLLFLGALLVAGIAQAEIKDGVRVKPTMSAQPIEAVIDGKTSMYMMNVGAQKFFTAGNAWGTQASIGDTGYRVYFEQFVIADAWDGTTVLFRDSCLAKSGAIKDVFFDTADGFCYVDRGSQTNFYWKLEKNADNAYYRLSMAENNPNYEAWQVAADSLGRTYFGWNEAQGTEARTFLYPSDTTHVDWAFYTVADYNAYQEALNVYNVAQELKVILDDAEGRGADVSAQKAVYLNEASTIEQINATMEEVRKIVEAYVDPNNPVDKTYFLTNPDFASNNSGWSGTSQGWENGVVEVYQGSFDTYQTVEGLPNGVYAVGVQSFLRPGWAEAVYQSWVAGEEVQAALYAKTAEDSVSTKVANLFDGSNAVSLGCGNELEIATNEGGVLYIPNMRSSANAYFEDAERGPNFLNKVYVVVSDGKLTVGVALRNAADGYWFVMDNWTLSFLGSKPAAYQMVLDGMLANAPVFAEDVVATEGYVDEFYGVVESLKGVQVTAYEEYAAAAAQYNAALAKVTDNVALWEAYKALVAHGIELPAMGGYVGDPVDELNDYCEFDAEDYFAEMALSNEELQAEMVKLQALIDAAMRCMKPGSEIQNEYVQNWNFETTSDGGSDGWGWEGSWGAFGGPDGNKNMEAYARDWDVHQEVKDAPVGLYEVSLSGFYRTYRGTTAWDLYHSGGQTCPGEVYVNNNASPLKCVFDEPVNVKENIYTGSTSGAEGDWCQFEDPNMPGDSLCYPNTMTSAGEAFTAGLYKSTASGVVARKGDPFVIGVRGKYVLDTWAIWDDFRVIYWGTQADKVLPHLQEAIAAGKANLEKPITQTVYDLVAKCVAEGETAAAEGTDGEKMFDALVALYNSNDSVNAVVADLQTLLDDAEALYDDIAISQSSADIIAEAGELAATIIDKIESRTMATAEIPALTKQLAIMRVKLRLPDYSGASDANAIDMTGVLNNPDFGDNAGTNTVDGWDNAAGSFGNDDTQKGVLAYEYWQKAFDMSQTVIGGLPNGTYRVEVQSFGRLGGSQDDFDAYKSNPDTMSTARPVIYAYATTDSAYTYKEEPVALYGSGASETDWAGEGTASVTDAAGNTFFTPNSVVSTSAWFAAGYYNNVLYVDVTDGTLCLGMKKATYNTNDWVMMDSWKLFYLGTNSAYGIEDVIAAPSAAQVAGVAVFNANGVQVKSLQKGLNIIRTVRTDGTVSVKKVMIK